MVQGKGCRKRWYSSEDVQRSGWEEILEKIQSWAIIIYFLFFCALGGVLSEALRSLHLCLLFHDRQPNSAVVV